MTSLADFSTLFEKQFKKKVSLLNLPKDYTIYKFFQLGYFAQYNTFGENYSCSCPLCMEGSSGIGNAKRCFYLPDKDIIYCHRCGWSSRPIKWIKEVSGMNNEEIQAEIIEQDFNYVDLDAEDRKNDAHKTKIVEKQPDLPFGCFNLLDINQIKVFHDNKEVIKAVRYLIERRLHKAVNRPDKWYMSLTDKVHKNRIIIPFYNEINKIVFYQSRTYDNSSNIRYISKIGGTKSVFNINNIDYKKDNCFIFEGPFDSCFVKNGVAVGGINPGKNKFSGIQEEQLDRIWALDKIWILDSQYLDEVAYDKSKILLQNNELVFIWPLEDGKKYKDFNEMALAKNLLEIPESYILENTFSGKSGELILAKRKKDGL